MMRIVIADDSTVVRQRLIRLLDEVSGVEVVGQADDVPLAKNLVEMLKPDVAILDIRMPTGSGADLVPNLKRMDPALKIIMLTNYAYPENRKKCMDSGADFFFDKSTEFQKVVTVLKGLLVEPGDK
jgi:DNA-binding NarL/FixJ family response regulator